ncbi:PAS domain-containing protein [Mycolicibacillus trivialis]
MPQSWLLVETLGAEPLVVAEGSQPQNLVPLDAYLRRNPRRAAITTAIAESVRTGEPLASITPKRARVIRTEPVRMSDGRIHGVQVWSGPIDTDPPERMMPGAVMWDLTSNSVTDTPESFANLGQGEGPEAGYSRAFGDEQPTRELRPTEAQVVALAIKAEPGQLLCSSWDLTDPDGEPIRVGFVARTALESGPDGRDHVISRGMNWRVENTEASLPPKQLAEQVLDALAQPGVYRALIDLDSWALLRWLDEPCPFYNWRSPEIGAGRVHPDDTALFDGMRAEFATGPSARVLRMQDVDEGWVPVHITVNRVEMDDEVSAGLVAMRLPTEEELAEAGLR